MSKPFKVLICSFTFFVLACLVASIRQPKVAPKPAVPLLEAPAMIQRVQCLSDTAPLTLVTCSTDPKTATVASDDSTCLAMESIRVGTDPALIGTGWRARMHNSCPQATTKNIHVRLAFYDAGNYRSGFTDFQILPMKPGERVKVEGFVSTDKGAVSAKLFQKTTNPADIQ